MDRPPPRAVGPQEGAVDVEENELHDTKIGGPAVRRTGGRCRGAACCAPPRPTLIVWTALRAAPPPGNPATASPPLYRPTGRRTRRPRATVPNALRARLPTTPRRP